MVNGEIVREGGAAAPGSPSGTGAAASAVSGASASAVSFLQRKISAFSFFWRGVGIGVQGGAIFHVCVLTCVCVECGTVHKSVCMCLVMYVHFVCAYTSS